MELGSRGEQYPGLGRFAFREWISGLGRDLRYTVRGMLRAPAFAITAILVLTLSTAAISTVLTIANTLLVRGLAVSNPKNIVIVSATRNHGVDLGWVSYLDYVNFRDQSRTITQLAAHYSSAPLFVSSENISEQINGAVVAWNFFPLLGIQPQLGRFFRSEEDTVPDRDRLVVISDGLWHKWFGASRDVLQKPIKINGAVFTIIGVAPASFSGVERIPTEIYIPLMTLRDGYRPCSDPLADPDCTMLSMIGRLAKGHTIDEAKAEMESLLPKHWDQDLKGANSGMTVYRPEGADRSQAALFLVRLLTITSGILVLVCCANVTGLLLVRGTARAGELALKISLGARRGRLIRQLLMESVVLGTVAGVLGILLSITLTGALSSRFYSWDSEGHPLHFNFDLSRNVVAAVLGIAVVTSVVFGLIAAVKSTRLQLMESVKRNSGTVSARVGIGRWLIGAQIAISVALVTNATLLAASAGAVNRGINFEASNVALMRIRPKLVHYPQPKAQQIQHEILRRLEELPEVESVSLVGSGWVVNSSATATVSLPEGYRMAGQELFSGYMKVGPNYFKTLRLPLRGGREFDNRDTVDTPPVAIVNEPLAHSLWPKGDVIGSTILIDGFRRQVVGIAADVPLHTRIQDPVSYVYVPYWQDPTATDARYCVRVKTDPAMMLPRLVQEVNRVDPNVPVGETLTLSIQVGSWFRPLRLGAAFFSYAAILAILLSAIGTYGIFAFVTSRRSKEMGIRMALGARPRSVSLMVLKEGAIIVGSSVVIGFVLALMGVHLIRHLLVGSHARDLLFYLIAGSVVACAGLGACLAPAYRISKIDPMLVLRQE